MKPGSGQPLLFGGTDDPTPPKGVTIMRGRLDAAMQAKLVHMAMLASEDAPFARPTMRDGTPFKAGREITSLGTCGWWSDEAGYRYVQFHPVTGWPWPPLPLWAQELAVALAREAGAVGAPPDNCLVNRYVDGGTLGLHVDDTESDLSAPVVGVSLGDACVFKAQDASWTLRSGDVVVLGGQGRLVRHGVTRTFPGSSSLVPGGGRLSLTFRRS